MVKAKLQKLTDKQNSQAKNNLPHLDSKEKCHALLCGSNDISFSMSKSLFLAVQKYI